MVLKKNQIVELRNGQFGIVTCFNDNPSLIKFKAFTDDITKYNSDLKKGAKEEYDIMRVFDGSTLENVSKVFTITFDPKEYNLPMLWERNEPKAKESETEEE